jgi:hypothetical protein
MRSRTRERRRPLGRITTAASVAARARVAVVRRQPGPLSADPWQPRRRLPFPAADQRNEPSQGSALRMAHTLPALSRSDRILVIGSFGAKSASSQATAEGRTSRQISADRPGSTRLSVASKATPASALV